MLYKRQQRIANAIGALIGAALLAFILSNHAPSTASAPVMGATVEAYAWVGGGLEPEPRRPKPFIEPTEVIPGGPSASGILKLRSRNSATERIALRLEDTSARETLDHEWARMVELAFGEGGKLGSTTLAALAENPLPPFTMKSGETKTIPISVTIPVTASEQIAGKNINFTIVGEQAK